MRKSELAARLDDVERRLAALEAPHAAAVETQPDAPAEPDAEPPVVEASPIEEPIACEADAPAQ